MRPPYRAATSQRANFPRRGRNPLAPALLSLYSQVLRIEDMRLTVAVQPCTRRIWQLGRLLIGAGDGQALLHETRERDFARVVSEVALDVAGLS